MRQLWIILFLMPGAIAVAETLVIAHRGASGYLPEHTLPAVAAAHAMGADYIEQDVVLTRDDHAIVLHDTTLERTTDVAIRFPDRAREDGHYYAVDFDLSEIQQLNATERRDEDGHAVFPQRFPVDTGSFRVPTLAEEIELIQGMNRSTGRNVGIYVELKEPEFHAEQGKDLAGVVLRELQQYGYLGPEDRAFIQCFNASTLRSMREQTGLPLVQLLADEELSRASAAEIAEYADAAGPSISRLLQNSDFVEFVHDAGMKIHPYTFRADQLPENISSFDELLDRFIEQLQVDGVFTDHPDLVRQYLNR